ncbi:dihydroorotate dehydrogenase electron transfer subunit [Bacteroidales bacterium OttesenSCG-928-K03]|nr:dihydroorotate dehydrogenase electron transfer subunit [Odoribacter sp. OttesenSCG-928-L07]MDL2238832.1 dihydroorotate dehydrogenase electron transfer subunit [Bacteroidales bacterium OttesenSCG-928-L14]MDL2240235.1 dihydroorotate dehydrogenase electron transfer subunit [Bacteroidales bacterium OttesenSCG-928-K22]MDL2242429.1 dihydroorotate dehydrogenase electron transfer subunit [Bacteroidales bacterium OttesenSCG-928-K03]
MKQIKNLIILENKILNNVYFILKCTADDVLPEMKPGQFASIKVENNPEVFLRRPFSIHDYDKKENTVSFLIKIVGKGTKELSSLKAGERISVMLPLGNGFDYNPNVKTLIIGGGCGIAPIYFLAKQLKSENGDFDILIGGRSQCDLLCQEELKLLSDSYCSTEDGSFGEIGFVTQNSRMTQMISNYKKIHCCGPENMMKAIAKIAKDNNIECEVSLENTMACGFGVCLCCVTETVRGNECVCTSGPVFNTKDLKW